MSVAAKKKKIFDGRYEVLSIVGRGACSVVYHARHAMTHTSEVALKVLLNQKGGGSNTDRLRKEALAMVSSRHKYVVRLDDFHSVRDLCYLAMEFAREGDLRKYVNKREGKLDPEQAERFFRQSAEALNFVHRVGITHRDIKPDNILVMNENEIRLADFGVAVLPGELASMEDLRAGVGTMSYMAPEVIEGKACDKLSDIYSLGVTFYEMLTGVHPFDNVPLIKQLEVREDRHVSTLTSKLSRVSPMLAQIIAKCMRYDPGARFPSMAELLRSLDRGSVDTHEAPPKRERPPVQEKPRAPKPPPDAVKPPREEPAPHSPERPPKSRSQRRNERRLRAKKNFPHEAAPPRPLAEGAPHSKPTSPNRERSGPPVSEPPSGLEAADEAAPDRMEEIARTESPVYETPASMNVEPHPEDAPFDSPSTPPSYEEDEESTESAEQIFLDEDELDEISPYGAAYGEEVDSDQERHIPSKPLLAPPRRTARTSPRRPREGSPLLSKVIFGVLIVVAGNFLLNKIFGLDLLGFFHERAPTQESDLLIPLVSEPITSFPNLPSGVYHGSIQNLVPGRTVPLAIVSSPGNVTLTFIIGVDGWTPMPSSYQDGAARSKRGLAENEIQVISNGFVLTLSGQVTDQGIVEGEFKNVITGQRGTWNAVPTRAGKKEE